MENRQKFDQKVVVTDILGKIVQEKSELVWVIPFAQELSMQVCREVLEIKYSISKN